MSTQADLAGKPRTWRSSLGLIVTGMLLGSLTTCTGVGLLSLNEPSVRVKVQGRDVSKFGGAKVDVVNERGRLSQTCNGECDDLILEADSGGNVHSVSVWDASGKCVFCGERQYLTSQSLADWTLGGRDKLILTQKAHNPYGQGS